MPPISPRKGQGSKVMEVGGRDLGPQKDSLSFAVEEGKHNEEVGSPVRERTARYQGGANVRGGETREAVVRKALRQKARKRGL